MRLARIFALSCVAVALLAAGMRDGHATGSSVACPGQDLQSAINGLGLGNTTLTVTGTCASGPTYGIRLNNVTLVAGMGGATINGQIGIQAAGVTLTGLTIDGTGLS